MRHLFDCDWLCDCRGLAGRFPWRPPTRPRRAVALLHQAAEALGGEAALRSMAAVELSGVSVWHQREQSERPEGPWVLTFADFTDTRNFAADAVRRTGRVRGYSTPDWVNNKEWEPDSTLLAVSGVGFRRADDRLQPTATPWDLATLPVNLGSGARRPLGARRSGRPYRR